MRHLLSIALACYCYASTYDCAHASVTSPVFRSPGPGFYEAEDISGPAADDIRSFMLRTLVPCHTPAGSGQCNLNASTDGAQILYSSTMALALLSFENDTGTVNGFGVALWKRDGAGRYVFVGFDGNAPSLYKARIVGGKGDDLLISAVEDVTGGGSRHTTRLIPRGNGDLSFSSIAEVASEEKAQVRTGGEKRPAVSAAIVHVAHVPASMIPKSDASPIAIVDFLMKTVSPDLLGINSTPVMKRILSADLRAVWKKAEDLADERHTAFFEGSWVSDNLDFEPRSWLLQAESNDAILAIMKDVAANETKARFKFIHQGSSWSISDVVYIRDSPRYLLPSTFSLRRAAENFNAQADPEKELQINRRKRVSVSGLDLDNMIYRGEHGTTYEHNGSEVVVFEKAGLIVYDSPKSSIAGSIKRGDVLFSGRISHAGAEGTAYTFKNGCGAAPYQVQGSWRHGDLELSGSAPITVKNGCEVVGYSHASPNARLRFRNILDQAG